MDEKSETKQPVSSDVSPSVKRSAHRRERTMFSESDLEVLESTFSYDQYPDIHTREHLAGKLNVTEDRIQVRLVSNCFTKSSPFFTTERLRIDIIYKSQTVCAE